IGGGSSVVIARIDAGRRLGAHAGRLAGPNRRNSGRASHRPGHQPDRWALFPMAARARTKILMSLQTIDLSVSRGSTPILSRVSLSIEPGRVLGLLGANGAGKSTLLAALAGELPPADGRVELDGTPLARIPLHHQARQR